MIKQFVYVLYDSQKLEVWSIDGVYRDIYRAKSAANRLKPHLAVGKWSAWKTGTTGSPDAPIPFHETHCGEKSITIMEMLVE